MPQRLGDSTQARANIAFLFIPFSTTWATRISSIQCDIRNYPQPGSRTSGKIKNAALRAEADRKIEGLRGSKKPAVCPNRTSVGDRLPRPHDRRV